MYSQNLKVMKVSINLFRYIFIVTASMVSFCCSENYDTPPIVQEEKEISLPEVKTEANEVAPYPDDKCPKCVQHPNLCLCVPCPQCNKKPYFCKCKKCERCGQVYEYCDCLYCAICGVAKKGCDCRCPKCNNSIHKGLCPPVQPPVCPLCYTPGCTSNHKCSTCGDVNCQVNHDICPKCKSDKCSGCDGLCPICEIPGCSGLHTTEH